MYFPLPNIRRSSIAGNDFIDLTAINSDIEGCMRTRSRFCYLNECCEKLAEIDEEDFENLTNKFIIRAANLNDAYIAAANLTAAIIAKNDNVGPFLLFSESPVLPDNPIQMAQFSCMETEELNRIFDRCNPVLHITSGKSIEIPAQSMLNRRPEFYISCENIRKGSLTIHGGICEICISSENDMTTFELMENILYSMDYDTCYTETELSKLAKAIGKADELTVMTYVMQVVNNHILNASGERELDPEDFKGITAGSSARKSAVSIGEGLVGLNDELAKLDGIINSLAFRMDRCKGAFSKEFEGCRLVFAGPPGTAKTTLARIFATKLAELGIIKDSGCFKECRKSDLVGSYVGHTAKNVDKLFSEMDEKGGGVLFFDEIYTLSEKDSTSFDTEALTCIVQNMENYRSSVFCIFAGYEDKMRSFLDSNPGLDSRISAVIRFSEYDDETLCKIFENIAKKENFTIPDSCKPVLKDFFSKLRSSRKEHFGNGREARNLFFSATDRHARNYTSMKNPPKKFFTTLSYEDIKNASGDILSSEITDNTTTIGF